VTIDYATFLDRKTQPNRQAGLVDVPQLSGKLAAFQSDLVTWALKRGRAALFADTGLGKTRMQLEWARRICDHTSGRVLVLTPLSVAKQTEAEGVTCGIPVRRAYDGSVVSDIAIYVTNYDRLHLFDGVAFDGVVLDESSIIKHHTAKTLGVLLERFKDTRFKLCCSATPSPNDHTELGTHAEFLGVCARTEMLSEFFCHDGGDTSVWRLKGHARHAFWRWVSSWAAMVRLPSDLGYDDTGYVLPPLHVHEHVSVAHESAARDAGLLFAEPARTLSARRGARRSTLNQRVEGVADLVRSNREQWVIWCELNAEQDAIASLLGNQCESIYGSMDGFAKEMAHETWLRGDARVLVTKPSIFGFGLNWQHCAYMVFAGVTDSYEKFYQAKKRIHRFGQKRSCHVHVFYNEIEGEVLKNLKRKEVEANKMAAELIGETREMVRTEVCGAQRVASVYGPSDIAMPRWMGRREADL
jgi:superfamily II DNA or RNA helicase